MQSRTAKRVLIVGAGGELGQRAVRAFEAAGWEVQRATRAAIADGEMGVALHRVEWVRAAAREHELIVNTVPHCELLIERAVLECGGALINISGLPAAAGRALRAVAGGARGTVILNAGLVPGISNLVAVDLLRDHPEADELELVLTLSALSARGPAGVAFIDHGLRAVSRHRVVAVPLPEPFGESDCLGFAEDDAGWLGGITEGRVVRAYVCFAERETQLRLLAQNGAGTPLESPASVGATRAGGRGCDEPVAHWIAAKRRGRRVSARTIQCRGNYVHAARAAVVFAEALLEKGPRAGCFDPEELFVLGELEPRLARAGISIVSRPLA